MLRISRPQSDAHPLPAISNLRLLFQQSIEHVRVVLDALIGRFVQSEIIRPLKYWLQNIPGDKGANCRSKKCRQGRQSKTRQLCMQPELGDAPYQLHEQYPLYGKT